MAIKIVMPHSGGKNSTGLCRGTSDSRMRLGLVGIRHKVQKLSYNQLRCGIIHEPPSISPPQVSDSAFFALFPVMYNTAPDHFDTTHYPLHRQSCVPTLSWRPPRERQRRPKQRRKRCDLLDIADVACSLF